MVTTKTNAAKTIKATKTGRQPQCALLAAALNDDQIAAVIREIASIVGSGGVRHEVGATSDGLIFFYFESTPAVHRTVDAFLKGVRFAHVSAVFNR